MLNIDNDVTRSAWSRSRHFDLGPPCRPELTELIARRGQPGMLVSDHGTEFTLNAILAWSKDHEVERLYRAGQAHAERQCLRLRCRMRDELLNESLFFGLDHAQSAIAEWVEDFNTARSHSSLGCQDLGCLRQSSPQPTPTFRWSKAPRLCRLLNPRQAA